jgi:hypothetical protein
MNENTQSNEREEDHAPQTQPNDENPGSFFCIPSAPHSNDSWSIN